MPFVPQSLTRLRQIGHRRLARLLKPFDEDLKCANFVLPEPDPQNNDYFADLANVLSIADHLPARLRQTLLTIDLITTMTPRALRTEDITGPVLFRVVDQHQPTLLLDEVDA